MKTAIKFFFSKDFVKGWNIFKLMVLTCGTLNASDIDMQKLIGAGNKVTAQVETAEYQWIGTENGIYRICKKNDKVAHITTANSCLPDNKITCMAARGNGEVFAGTAGGILRYDGFAFLKITTENSKLPSNNISGLACDQYDMIWVGTADYGIATIENNRIKTLNTSNSSLQSNKVCKVYLSRKGCITVVLPYDAIMVWQNNQFVLPIGYNVENDVAIK